MLDGPATYFDRVHQELADLFESIRGSERLPPGVWHRATETVILRELAAHDAAGALLVELAAGEPASRWLAGKDPWTIAAVLTVIASLSAGRTAPARPPVSAVAG